MKRFIFFLVLFFGLLTLTVAGCASTNKGATLRDASQIALRVENYVNERITIYSTWEGSVARRIGDCESQTVCVFALDERSSAHALHTGYLEIGYRHFHDPRPGPTNFVSTPAFRGMLATLVINRIDEFLTPGVKQVDD